MEHVGRCIQARPAVIGADAYFIGAVFLGHQIDISIRLSMPA